MEWKKYGAQQKVKSDSCLTLEFFKLRVEYTWRECIAFE